MDNWLVLFTLLGSLIALAFVGVTARKVLRFPEGTETMKKIAASIGEDYGFDPSQKKDNRLTVCEDMLDEYFKLADAKVQLYKSPLQEQNFIDCCISREQTISPAETGARAAILCQLCNMSYMYDSSFDWDPVKCTFANGTGDPTWLKRAVNRNGWDIKL